MGCKWLQMVSSSFIWTDFFYTKILLWLLSWTRSDNPIYVDKIFNLLTLLDLNLGLQRLIYARKKERKLWKSWLTAAIQFSSTHYSSGGTINFFIQEKGHFYYITFCLSLMDPRPSTAILVMVSSWRRFIEFPLGPRSFPTKLN